MGMRARGPGRGSEAQAGGPGLLEDALDPDAFVGGIGAGLAVEAGHLEAAGVMEADEVLLLMEDRAAGAAALGRRAIVEQALAVLVEQQVVVQGERERTAAGVADDVDLLGAVGNRWGGGER